MKHKKQALMNSVISLLLCASMLVGTTYAWFTDGVSTGINTIAAGNLDVELYHTNAAVTDEAVTGDTELFLDLQGDPILWEPGVVSYENLRIANEGELALAYQLAISTANENFVVDPSGAQYGLSQILKVGVVEGGITATDREAVVASVDAANWTTLANFLRNGSLLPEGEGESEKTWGIVIYWQPGENDNFWNLNNGKQLSEGEVLSIDLGVKLIATQETHESDSFGSDYDTDAKTDVFPVLDLSGAVTTPVVPGADNRLTEQVVMISGQVTATIPAGVQLAPGTNALTMSVTEMEESGANIVLDEDEAMLSLDVHIGGIDAANTVPMIIDLGEVLPTGLNIGNYTLHHVENGVTVAMTKADAVADLDAHNEFYYDPATGNVTVALATFSEVALVAEPAAWEGKFDYSWYTDAKARTAADYTIANADQLAALSAIVGGMNGQTQDSFAGKTVKLISDINLGDKESKNNSDIIFYPIGYYNSEGTYERTNTAITSGLRNFEGTFDGNGHTVSNFYQNTWEMKGDHDWYSPEEQYYRDGMGLFGRVYKGTVKNLTIKNFSSDGEIATTGCVAAYADGATFENIAIFNCNPRVYNIGNGGIVGCVGWYAKEADLKTTFKNVTVDNSNKISALWGSYDVACGGIVGQYYPTSGQTSAGTPKNAGISFENCHIAAQMDVYNDVCANYQYYAYRYTGMLIGSVRENETIGGHVYPKMDGITASGCTVHFGTWNDYYYCEIIDNTTASYTHDYQMSRLTEIKAIDGTTITYLDGTTGTVPASGRANYVIVDYTKGHGTENATCYHFKDGAVWTHDMGGIQTGIDENGDGKDDLKEDKQHIYLEFNNLVTGYGWGVTSRGFSNLDGVTNLDITPGKHEQSVEKFEVKLTNASNALMANQAYTIGNLFAAIENVSPAINDSAVRVAVTAINDSEIIGTYAPNTSDWTQGTLTFNTVEGMCLVTIQDYNFCKPTSFVLNDGKLYKAEKFDKLFTGNFLYRVGNVNEVALSTLFVEKNGTPVGKVTVTVETVSGNAAGALTAKDAWKDGTIQFSGTGLAKVTIKDEDITGIPTELMLEVVDAYNTLSAVSAPYVYAGEKHNVVLLKENTTSSGFTVKDGYAFYGNGFKVTCSGKGTYLNNGGMTLGYASVQTGGILDNVKIICDIYPNAFLYTEEVKVSTNLDKEASTDGKSRYMYQLSAISVSGDGSVVANCYAYGGRNNIFVGGGDVLIENTVTECGTLSNIQIKGSSDDTVILKDVTTIQYRTTSKYDASKVMLGFGVVVGDNESESNANIVLQGDLKQYNWVTSDDTSVSNTYAKAAIEGALKVQDYQHTINGKTAVNMGIAYLNTKTTSFPSENDQRSNKNTIPYKMNEVTMSGENGYVYSISGSTIDANSRYDAETDGITPDQSAAQKDIAPTPVFSLGNQAVNGEDRYLKGDMNGITARYENGQDPFTLDISKLVTASKYGTACTVNATCKDPDGIVLNGTVTLNKPGVYTLTFTIVDDLFYSETGEKIENKELRYSHSVKLTLTIAEPSVPDATLTVDTSKEYSGQYTDSTADGSKKMSFNPLDAIEVTDAGSEFNLTSNVKTVDISYSAYGTDGKGNAFGGNTTITVTYNEGQVLTIVFTKVTSNSPGNPKSITYDPDTGTVKSSSTLAKNSCTAAEWKVVSYSFAGKNGKTVTREGVIFKIAADTSGGCVTPDTLITLADGSQVRVDSLTGDEMLLVWNLETGKYDVAPIVFVDSEEEAEYEIIHLYFSDGSDVKVIYEHGFFDLDLGKYVYIDATNYTDYIGHRFVTEGDIKSNSWKVAILDEVVIEKEVTTAWSPVTFAHLCYFTNGVLSMPGGIAGLFNIFEVDTNTMRYDMDLMIRDIETYGLFTLEDFGGMITEEAFRAFNGAYLKVAIGKGLLTWEAIAYMAERYIPLM